MDESSSRRICQLIAGIVVSDEDLAPKEEAFIEKVLARFGLDPAERDAIFPIVEAGEAAGEMKALPESVRDEAFELLVQAAAADGSIEPEELTYLETVADAVGVSRDELSDRLAAALQTA